MNSTDGSTRVAKVVLVGDTGVGKTSIVTNFVTGQFDKFAEPTIGYVPPVKLPSFCRY